jgi:decaprenylphospho-beta-D-erythro-pentofuranosid-2-ulose 2-reductase
MSAIAQAFARLAAATGATLLLVGRNEENLRANAADLLVRGGNAALEAFDLAGRIDRNAVVDELIARHRFPDEVLVAYGILGDQERALTDLAHARDVIEVNFTSVVLWLLAIRARRDPARSLTFIAIGLVAGDRGLATNFVYGSAKGGLDRFLEGMQHAHARSPLNVIRVKPGFVDTPMIATIEKGGPLRAKPDQVSRDIQRAVERHAAVVYTPWFWRLIMLIIRNIPPFPIQPAEDMSVSICKLA